MSFLRDLSVGARSLVKTPALAIVCVGALTLGIGLTTMMFSITYGAIMRGLPYPDGDRIDVVYRTNPALGGGRQSISLQDYHDVSLQQRSYAQLAAFTGGTMNVSGKERAERYSGSWVTSNLSE